jgi:hypothetical protein
MYADKENEKHMFCECNGVPELKGFYARRKFGIEATGFSPLQIFGGKDQKAMIDGLIY